MSEDTSTPTIPKDLEQKIGAIEGLATAHRLLDTGLYSHRQFLAIKVSMDFLKELYESVVAEALAHPDADKSEALQNLAKERALKAEKERLAGEAQAAEGVAKAEELLKGGSDDKAKA